MAPTAIGRATRLLIALLGLLLIGWGLGALSRWALTSSDLRVVQAVASSRTPAQITIARVFSWLGSGWVVFPLAALCSVVLAVRGRRPWALAICLSTVGAALIANLDKPLVGRPRPHVHPLDTAIGASFPSGHAAQSTGFLVALVIPLFAVRARRWIKVGAAAACSLLVLSIASSRVYLGVHYPSDVAFGVLLGATWTVIVTRHFAALRASGENDPSSRRRARAGEGDGPVIRRGPRSGARAAR
jgi:undecaprenyl-diphosphatase